MNSGLLLGIRGAAILALAWVAAGARAGNRPNVVFLLADDMGYGELGCYGQTVMETPFLDRLASEGMRFTDFYAGSAVCSPSRAVLFTGKHSGHVSVRGNQGLYSDGKWDRIPLAKDETTLAEMLKGSGYQTGFVGKWHLDNPDDLSTWAAGRGFDYAVQEQWSNSRGGERFDGPLHFVNGREGSVYYEENDHECIDEFRTNFALEYLDQVNREKPFFLFMSYRIPHAHERYIRNRSMYGERGWPDVERRHAARITMLDAQIKRLYDKLEAMGELENTVIIFTSDNGGHHELDHDHQFFMSNGQLLGYKRDLYEGGIRVPFIAYWKGKIAAGSVSDHIGASYDFMPTIAEIAGVDCPAQSDGLSLLPELMGKSQAEHDHLYWEIHAPHKAGGAGAKGFRQAIRQGEWKAVRYGVDAKSELYDLSVDLEEKDDLSGRYPDRVAAFEELFRSESVDVPHFPYGGLRE